MLEDERSTFITVALQAWRLIPVGDTHALRQIAGMRIVAVGARHRAFREPMFIRFLKCRPD